MNAIAFRIACEHSCLQTCKLLWQQDLVHQTHIQKKFHHTQKIVLQKNNAEIQEFLKSCHLLNIPVDENTCHLLNIPVHENVFIGCEKLFKWILICASLLFCILLFPFACFFFIGTLV